MSSRSSGDVRLLVVIAAPDRRVSTDRLHAVADALSSRPSVTIETWFLRDPQRERWPGSRNVDSLRHNPLDGVLRLLGLRPASNLIRGLRLRFWFSRLAPQVVLLDDGYGLRLLRYAPTSPIVIVRENPVEGETFGLDESQLATGDLKVSHRCAPLGQVGAGTWLQLAFEEGAPAGSGLESLPLASGPPRDVDPSVPTVAGWGTEGWIDGSDIFVRTMWYVRHRLHRPVVATWFLPEEDQEERRRLEREIQLCGLEAWVHLGVLGPGAAHWACDVVLAPARDGVAPPLLLEAGRREVPVVAFAPAPLAVPWVREAPMLDLPRLAAEVCAAIDLDFPEPRDRWPSIVEPDRFADRLLDTVRGRVT